MVSDRKILFVYNNIFTCKDIYLMKQLFGFMDETGILSNSKHQRFFALGLLKLENTSALFESIQKLKDKYSKKKGFEFKFTDIRKDQHLEIHKELIDICFSYPEFSLSCIIIDKDSENHTAPDSTWEMQLDLSKRHVRRNVKADEQISIIADYLSKPKASPKYFEDELKRLQKVFNACMIESDSSVFVQVVDIFIGCIVYRYKIEYGLEVETTPKGKLVKYIESKLELALHSHNNSSGKFKHHKKLAGAFTIFEPFYFSVYEKRKK
jgi:hypothetical protein